MIFGACKTFGFADVKMKIFDAPNTIKNFVFDASKIENFRMLCV